jgi:hypothetical protein
VSYKEIRRLDLTIFLPVVQQAFETDVFKTTVVSGNNALFKCEIPAHIGDLVGVSGWVDSQGQDLNRQGNNAAAEASVVQSRCSVSQLIVYTHKNAHLYNSKLS